MSQDWGNGARDSEEGTTPRRGLWTVTSLFLAVALASSLLLLGLRLADVRLPGNHQGFEPAQPIAFSHRLHSGEMKVPCLYCHHSARKARTAGFPAAQLCLNCHRFVHATLGAVRAEERLAADENRQPVPVKSTEIEKIYRALGLNFEMEPSGEPKPIEWVRVSNLPDFVYFNHSAHYAAGVDCVRCHGQVNTMERISQVESFSMGWCVNCHREYTGRVVNGRVLSTAIDCSNCHL